MSRGGKRIGAGRKRLNAGEKRVKVGTAIKEKLIKILENEAAIKGLTKSQLIALIVERHLERAKGRKKRTGIGNRGK